MMASTIGPIDAGIVAALEDAYFKKTDLLNYIAVIRVNPARLPRVEVDRYGEPLFFPNSDDWRKRQGGSS